MEKLPKSAFQFILRCVDTTVMIKRAFLPISCIMIFLIFSCSRANQRIENNGLFKAMPMQVGIVVSDLEESLNFYTNVIGMTEVRRFSFTAELAAKVGLTDNKSLDAVVLKLNDVPGAAEYKLVKIEGLKREPLLDSFIPGLRYITIHVKNFDQHVERLKNANIKTLTDGPIILPSGMQILSFLDPDGALIEILGE